MYFNHIVIKPFTKGHRDKNDLLFSLFSNVGWFVKLSSIGPFQKEQTSELNNSKNKIIKI